MSSVGFVRSEERELRTIQRARVSRGYKRLARLTDRDLGVEPRGIVELVDDVAVLRQRQPGIVAGWRAT